MLMHSTEIRWFFRGEPGPAQRWFSEQCHGHQEKTRIDEYLVLPGCDTVGIKLRGENFEVKALRVPARAVAIGPDISGLSDSWVKWVLTGAVVASLGPAIRNESQLAPVEKLRWIVKYSFDSGAPETVDADSRPNEGCIAEFTRLQFMGEIWWSIALEAFGSPEETQDHLRRAGAHFFGRKPPFRGLSQENSFSYPAWVQRLMRQRQPV